MNGRRNEERLYTAVVLAFLVGLVALGLLGIPALLVAAIGAVVAAMGIAIFHRSAGSRSGLTPSRRGGHHKVPERYVPTVLEGSSMKRRRIAHLRRHRNASPPLRFR
ncbi:MAG TPA: hypothetical protein VH268_07360 [Solirubrobacterales bacterium]|jgi:hypothetical protein|nr:hypothetical protein [Solirubrobacterales bacterium]